MWTARSSPHSSSSPAHVTWPSGRDSPTSTARTSCTAWASCATSCRASIPRLALYEALELAKKSDLPCDRLKADIYGWRSRCYRRQRDWEAAREDVELALSSRRASATPACSPTPLPGLDRSGANGHWVLARNYAERAKDEYERLADKLNYGRMMNNLGGLNFLLGNPDEAARFLKDAFHVALDNDDRPTPLRHQLARPCPSRDGPAEQSEEQARKALELLGGREDHSRDRQRPARARAVTHGSRPTGRGDEWLRAADSSFERSLAGTPLRSARRPRRPVAEE